MFCLVARLILLVFIAFIDEFTLLQNLVVVNEELAIAELKLGLLGLTGVVRSFKAYECIRALVLNFTE